MCDFKWCHLKCKRKFMMGHSRELLLREPQQARCRFLLVSCHRYSFVIARVLISMDLILMRIQDVGAKELGSDKCFTRKNIIFLKPDRKSVAQGKSVSARLDNGGRRNNQKQKN